MTLQAPYSRRRGLELDLHLRPALRSIFRVSALDFYFARLSVSSVHSVLNPPDYFSPPLATRHFLFYASSMFGKRRQLETEAELYDVALRALMRRAHSVHEMKQKLERRSDNKLLVQVVMARLTMTRGTRSSLRGRGPRDASRVSFVLRETCGRAGSRTGTSRRRWKKRPRKPTRALWCASGSNASCGRIAAKSMKRKWLPSMGACCGRGFRLTWCAGN